MHPFPLSSQRSHTHTSVKAMFLIIPPCNRENTDSQGPLGARGIVLDSPHGSQGGVWDAEQLECSSVPRCRTAVTVRAGSLRCLFLGEGPLSHQWLETSGRSRDSHVHIAPGECSLKTPRARFSETSSFWPFPLAPTSRSRSGLKRGEVPGQ